MKTPFGKELVKIRLDNNIALKDMAAGLKVKASYLSAVESASKTSSKKLTPEFLEKILSFLSLSEEKEQYLRTLAAMSVGECRIDTSALEFEHLDTLTMFARKAGSLKEEQLQTIREILK